jgi:hypothetical protein
MKFYILPDGTTVKRVRQKPGEYYCNGCHFYGDDCGAIPHTKKGLIPNCYNESVTIHYIYKQLKPQQPNT